MFEVAVSDVGLHLLTTKDVHSIGKVEKFVLKPCIEQLNHCTFWHSYNTCYCPFLNYSYLKGYVVVILTFSTVLRLELWELLTDDKAEGLCRRKPRAENVDLGMI